MAENDPTRESAPVSLDLEHRDREFLQEVLTMARDGVRDELSEHGQQVHSPERLRREQAALERLLTGVEQSRILPDPDAIAVLHELADIIDSSNDYRRVVAEHGALHGLIATLERRRGSCSRSEVPCAATRCRGDDPRVEHC